jgi:hypothetical protein
MKESYERKVQDLQKVKMQNIQLLSIAGIREYYFSIISSLTLVHAAQSLQILKVKWLRFFSSMFSFVLFGSLKFFEKHRITGSHTEDSCRHIFMLVMAHISVGT